MHEKDRIPILHDAKKKHRELPTATTLFPMITLKHVLIVISPTLQVRATM